MIDLILGLFVWLLVVVSLLCFVCVAVCLVGCFWGVFSFGF